MADQVVGKLIEVVKKKNKAGVAVKPFQVQFDCSLFTKIQYLDIIFIFRPYVIRMHN